jgi:hypothetical protein
MRKAKHMKRPSFPHHQNLAKGGVVKMAAGGVTPTAVSAGAIQAPAPVASAPANTLQSAPSSVNTTAATGAGGQGITGNISNLVGTNNNFQGQAANLTPGTNTGQLNQAYQGAQGALANQQNLVNLTTPGVLGAVNNQNTLANQYLAMSQGQGPNPAQAQLNQATGANVANQAALMAGQRGAGANVGLMARQAAQQGASTQQQAVGQAATLEAQQQIAAQQNLANLSAQQVGQAGTAVSGANQAQQNEQNILQNANTSLNNADVSMQSNLNNVNLGAATANQQNNTNILGGIASQIPVISSIFEHGGAVKMAGGGQINANPLLGNQPNSAASGWAAPQFNQSNASSGPVVPGTPEQPAIQSPFGGKKSAPESQGALGTQSEDSPSAASMMSDNSGQYGSSLMNAPDSGVSAETVMNASPADFTSVLMAAPAMASGGRICPGPHRSHVANFMASGGKTGDVKALVSPKEIYLTPEQVGKVVHEGADPVKIGHRFPGTDKVKGRDSKKNDVIPTTLRAGGVVIPVHITTHKDASNKARKFVGRTMAKHMKRPAGA